MTSLESLVHRAREGDDDAFGAIVRRFQDMAVGYAYSILRDFQLAEDSAQESFLEAYRHLDQLREPAAFSGWFRRIVFKQCDRITRNKHFDLSPLDAAAERAAKEPTQPEAIEQHEMTDKILAAVDSLPEHVRSATMLFYIGGYSQDEVAAFLGVPISTVKKRLYSARRSLREMLVDLVEDSLRERRPSRDELFSTRVIEILKAARSGDVIRVKHLLEQDRRLIAARDPLGNTALILATTFGHSEVAKLLLSAGVKPDIFEAASIGRTELVAQFLSKDAELLDSYSPEGFTAVALAAHFGQIDTLEFLIAQGANINAVSKHPMNVTPLHAALFGLQIGAAKILLKAGADVRPKRGGAGWPRAGWTALHYAAGFGLTELARSFLDNGAELDASDDEGKTPIDVALGAGYTEVADLLRKCQSKGAEL